MRQKTDSEYVEDFKHFRNERYKAMVVDPSASSFITALVYKGEVVKRAKNDVHVGIQKVYRMLRDGKIKINSDNCPMLILD